MKEAPQRKICMLVTSGVVNDSRVIREAVIASENLYNVKVIGRYVKALGPADPKWPFSVRLIDIPRVEKKVVAARVVERIKIGIIQLKEAVSFRPDVIHCNDFDTLPFGYLAARILNCALVYDSHEIWTENGFVSQNKFGKKLAQMVERFLIRRCDHVVSVSNAARRWLSQKYIISNISVVTNCPFISNVDFMEKSPCFELLCHGKYDYDRGYEELIACAALVKEQGIYVRLRSYGIFTEHFENLVRQSGCDNIILSEKVPAEQVVSAATTSHVGIVLTRPVSISYEMTVSNRLFECAAAGLPLILSNVPEHKYLNDKYHFGIILEEISPEALASAAIELKNNKKLYAELSRNALDASKELCWESEGKKLIDIYNNSIRYGNKR